MTKDKVRAYLIIAIAAILMIFLLRNCEEDNHEIIGGHLSGHISAISNEREVIYIKLDSSNKWIQFVCEINKTAQPQFFYYYIRKGDSIFKNALSDTIFVIRDGNGIGWKLSKKN